MKLIAPLACLFLIGAMIADPKGLPWSKTQNSPHQAVKADQPSQNLLASSPISETKEKDRRFTTEERLEFLCNPDGSVKPIPAELESEIETVWGRVYQQIGNGRIIMESNLGFISLVYHGNEEFIDGEYLGKFKGLKIGTHCLALASGGTRTVLEVLYIPKEALAPAGPGAWMHDPNRRSALDR